MKCAFAPISLEDSYFGFPATATIMAFESQKRRSHVVNGLAGLVYNFTTRYCFMFAPDETVTK